jgi:DNA (cytosine-5)-methyltransferase 1
VSFGGNNTQGLIDSDTFTLAIRGRGDSHDLEYRTDGTANGVLTPNGDRAGIGVGAVAFSCKDHGADVGDTAPTLRAMGHAESHPNAGGQVAVAFDARQSDVIQYGESTGPLDTCGFTMGIQTEMAVRRLTPRECDRLQGFKDDYTLIPYNGKPVKDGQRYKALGNSMAVSVMRWIGERIQAVSVVCAREGRENHVVKVNEMVPNT